MNDLMRQWRSASKGLETSERQRRISSPLDAASGWAGQRLCQQICHHARHQASHQASHQACPQAASDHQPWQILSLRQSRSAQAVAPRVLRLPRMKEARRSRPVRSRDGGFRDRKSAPSPSHQRIPRSRAHRASSCQPVPAARYRTGDAFHGLEGFLLFRGTARAALASATVCSS